MTAPTQDPETLGWLMCHNRVRGCEWATDYWHPDQLFDAEKARWDHEMGECKFKPQGRHRVR